MEKQNKIQIIQMFACIRIATTWKVIIGDFNSILNLQSRFSLSITFLLDHSIQTYHKTIAMFIDNEDHSIFNSIYNNFKMKIFQNPFIEPFNTPIYSRQNHRFII